MAHVRFLVRAGLFPSLVFALHCVLSLAFNAYAKLPWLDVVMHVLGGLAIATFIDQGLRYLVKLEVLRLDGRAARSLMVFGLVAASTVFWEFAEFLADRLLDVGAQRSVANVMKDQFFGLVGGCAYLVWAAK